MKHCESAFQTKKHFFFSKTHPKKLKKHIKAKNMSSIMIKRLYQNLDGLLEKDHQNIMH